uniref:Uncharacterized protein n=1 Tax=Knipowitschia caucasica TaxID=637954 RepID=A0AAV2JGU9_KNICA
MYVLSASACKSNHKTNERRGLTRLSQDVAGTRVSEGWRERESGPSGHLLLLSAPPANQGRAERKSGDAAICVTPPRERSAASGCEVEISSAVEATVPGP